MGKQRHREGKQLPQDRTSSKEHSWASNPGTLDPKLIPLTSIPRGLPRPTNQFCPTAVQRMSINFPSMLRALRPSVPEKRDLREDPAQALQRRDGRGHLCPAGGWEEAEFGLDLDGNEGGYGQIQKHFKFLSSWLLCNI